MGGHLILAAGGQWGFDAWVWLIVPLTLYGLISMSLFCLGKTSPDEPNVARFFFGQISDSLRRATGYPGWSMAGVLSGLLFLLVLVIGFYWDVAWHIDNGRDLQLFTPSHVMILVGLGGLVYTAALTVLFASLDRADVGWRLGPLRVPWSAMVVGALGVGGIAAFPLDNLWHQAYGIDVTLWSPTHLQLVAGGSFATIALLLMCAEGRPTAEPTLLGRGIYVLTAGTVLVAMSTFQGEFDFGVPQFQALYLPLLVMVAAGFALVLARVALGPWGAVKAVFVYLVLRGFLALVVGGALGHTVPRFPLYLPSALAVEAAAWALGTDRRLRFGLGAGALVGTAGLLGELVWLGLTGDGATRLPVDLVVKIALLAPLAALTAAVLGAGLARAFSAADDRVPITALAAAAIVLVGVFAYPFPRRVGHVGAVVRLSPWPADQATVEVQLTPPDAARDAVAFVVTSWQGGDRRVTARFEEIGPGRYRTTRPVPIVGRWKTVVSLLRGDQVMAAPVYLPADDQIKAPAVLSQPERTTAFVRNTKLLLREAHSGPAWPAVSAWSGLAGLMMVWSGLMALTARRIRSAEGDSVAGAVPPAAPRWVPGPPPPRQPEPVATPGYSARR